jgi:hypothetical protein
MGLTLNHNGGGFRRRRLLIRRARWRRFSAKPCAVSLSPRRPNLRRLGLSKHTAAFTRWAYILPMRRPIRVSCRPAISGSATPSPNNLLLTASTRGRNPTGTRNHSIFQEIRLIRPMRRSSVRIIPTSAWKSPTLTRPGIKLRKCVQPSRNGAAFFSATARAARNQVPNELGVGSRRPRVARIRFPRPLVPQLP